MISVPITSCFGASCRNSSRFFWPNLVKRKAMPVTFPSGLAMLDTRPDPMGSLPVRKTIGMVFVAAFAARLAGNNSASYTDLSW